MNGPLDDPYLSYRFHVEFDGLLAGSFSEVGGLEGEVEVETYEEGGVNHFVHHLPKGVRFGNLVLTRGLMPKQSILWNWWERVRQGCVERLNGRVIIFDQAHNEAEHWRFLDALPVRIKTSELSGTSDAVFTETLELAHNGVMRGST